MSEYQYYEFRAVDRPLNAAEQAALRALTTRAEISATSLVNEYEWGDFKGDPRCLMERYFDLFLYLASWGVRRLSIRVPARLIDIRALDRFFADDGGADAWIAGPHAIVDIWRDDIDQDDWSDDVGQLAALAPLRGDIMQGDLRVFYLVWLIAVEKGLVDDDAIEPLGRIAPLSASLQAFVDFFAISPDLVEAAIDLDAVAPSSDTEREAIETFIRSLPEEEKIALLMRLHDGEPHLGAELRRRRMAATGHHTDPNGGQRSAGELREAAGRIAAQRHRAATEAAAARERRREIERAQARKQHLALLAERGEAPWQEVEDLISRRNQPGYERAVTLLGDLGELARSRGGEETFARRLNDIRTRHDRKGRLIERLDEAGLR